MQEQLKVFDEEIQKLKEQEKGEERNERSEAAEMDF